MGMGIGLAALAALVILAVYLLRAGHPSGTQHIGKHMGGYCSAHSIESSTDTADEIQGQKIEKRRG